MANNFLNYTGLTYDDIKADIMSRLSEDSRFSNFRESALYSVITEIFTATTDFTNYYMERRAEESFLDSAQLRSSVVLLSKMLGYVITRPIPATTSFKIRIKSLPPLSQVGDVLSITAGTSFSFNGTNFILPKGIEYKLTTADLANFTNDPQYFKDITYRADDIVNDGKVFDDSDSRSTSLIKLIQGEKRVKTIDASSNAQMGKRYQAYTIEDPTFANLYGDQDIGYSITNPGLTDITSNWTRVAIGSDEATAFCASKDQFDSKSEFWIDRRSFLNNDTIPLLSATGAGANVKYCVIRTTMSDGVELLFGDDNVSRVGAKTNLNVYVRYLSTLGAKANTVGVIGKTIQCLETSYGRFNQSNVEFILTSNITGGADIESMESIKINSPEIFYSLERCVTPRDYVSYLKTLVLTTKSVKNAIAWGEQEETRSTVGLANIKLFNVVLFSVLSDMYAKMNDSVLGEIYTGLDTDTNILVAPTSATDHDWFKVMMLSDSTTPLKTVQADNSPEMKDLKRVYDNLYTRSQLTVKNVYVAPIIQDFYLSGTIYFNPLIDKNTTTKKINNVVYSHLSMNADFNTPIYNSTIVDLIENFPEVHHADVYLVPKDTEDDIFSMVTSGSGTPSISANFSSVPVGFVYSTSWVDKETFGTREYSRTPVDAAIDIQKMVMMSNANCQEMSAFASPSYESIFCLLPEFEVKSTKIDSDFVESKLIWPSSNSYDTNTCGLVTEDTSASDVYGNYYPSERNLYLGLMKCYLDKLNVLAQKDQEALSTLIEKWDAILSSTKCICSLKEKNVNDIAINTTAACKENVLNAQVSDIRKYISEYFYYYVKLLRSTFLYDIRQNMIDSSGNITNFSMSNEIARVDLTNLKYSYT